MNEKKAAQRQDRSEKEQQVCTACGGTGHLNLFHGESRFLLSGEECPLCHGTGQGQEKQSSMTTQQSWDNAQG